MELAFTIAGSSRRAKRFHGTSVERATVLERAHAGSSLPPSAISLTQFRESHVRLIRGNGREATRTGMTRRVSA